MTSAVQQRNIAGRPPFEVWGHCSRFDLPMLGHFGISLILLPKLECAVVPLPMLVTTPGPPPAHADLGPADCPQECAPFADKLTEKRKGGEQGPSGNGWPSGRPPSKEGLIVLCAECGKRYPPGRQLGGICLGGGTGCGNLCLSCLTRHACTLTSRRPVTATLAVAIRSEDKRAQA
jgi:hypothetical protein